MKKVLIVEDRRSLHSAWRVELAGKVEVLSAYTIEEARELFDANRDDIAAIVLDACVPGDDPNTLPLAQEFGKVFGGPMIAISGDEFYRTLLMSAGCNHESEKNELSKKICEVLEQSQ